MNKDNNSNNNKQIMNRGSQNKMMMIIIIIIIIHSNLPLWQVCGRAGFTLTHVMSRENFSWGGFPLHSLQFRVWNFGVSFSHDHNNSKNNNPFISYLTNCKYYKCNRITRFHEGQHTIIEHSEPVWHTGTTSHNV